jgi:integrase
MPLEMKHFIAQNGERFSQLYQKPSDGFPLFYPTAYCSRNLRVGFSHNTQVDYLLAIKKLYEWAEFYLQPHTGKAIDLHERLITRVFFTPYEIDSMVAFISVKKNTTNGETLVGSKINIKLSVIARYLSWHAEEVITDSNRIEVQACITKMAKMITAKKVSEGSDARRKQKTLAKKLNDDARTELLNLFNDPLKGVNSETNCGSRIRNVTKLRVLYETGMRVGELHGLRLSDYQMALGGDPAILEVHRYHDDYHDDRINQPAAKTLERPIPIDEELSNFISTYIKDWRSKVPNVGFDDNDFLFVTHRKGNRQGKASTISSFNSGITTLKKQRPNLVYIHPHLLRHDWNYRFSIQAKELGYSESEERAIREFLMGWVDDSPSAALYNRRRIQEQAFALGIKVATYTAERK